MGKNIEVLLREHVDTLGRCGDVVNVRSGYARNFLFPKKFAVPATDENRRVIARRAARIDAEEAAQRESLAAVVEAANRHAHDGELRPRSRLGRQQLLHTVVAALRKRRGRPRR